MSEKNNKAGEQAGDDPLVTTGDNGGGAPAGEGDGQGELTVDELLAELETAREEAKAAHDKMLRVAADFENQKKRLIREKDISLKYAEESIVKEILPFVDNLERALEQDPAVENFGEILREGVEMTLNGLITSLGKTGLKALESLGEPFDPNFHEAMAMEASEEVPAQRVLKVYEKGYLFKDKLLRAAKVVVSSGNEDG